MKTQEYISSERNKNPEVGFEIIAFGKKGAEAMARNQLRVFADFKKVDVNLRIEDVLPISALVSEGFARGDYDRVVVSYTDFISTLSQKPRLKQLLPFPRLAFAKDLAEADELGKVGKGQSEEPERSETDSRPFEYLFEPKSDQVLAKLLPRLLEMQLYQAMLESNASEHSARMVAMKNASDAAAELITDLTLEFNQLRQSAITREIAEISAGRMAIGRN